MNVTVSQLHLPSGSLSLIESAVRELSTKLPPSAWLDGALLSQLLVAQPIRAQQIKRHYCVVGGFRTYHLAIAMIPPSKTIPIEVVTGGERSHIEAALAALLAHVLDGQQGEISERRFAYNTLRRMALNLKSYPNIKIPSALSPRDLRAALNIMPHETKNPRARLSDYGKLMGARK
jgi:hypothetical protein